VGSAHDEAGLGLLLAEAAALVSNDAQGVLDLGLDVPARAGALLGPAGQGVLFGRSPGRAAVRAVPAAQVVRTFSAVLYDVIGAVFDDLGFGVVGDECFRDLVITRVVEPTSLLDVDRVLADLGRTAASLSTRKRTLKRCQEGSYRSQITAACFAYAQANGDISLLLYDVTTLYFEAEKEDELRKVGFSKERRVDPQIVVGLLVDRLGFPLEVGCFEGNMAEKLTIMPVIEAFKTRHGIEHMVVAADAGMLSAGNLAELDEAGFKFIVGARTTKAPIDLASHFRWHGDAFTDGQIIDTITPKVGKNTDNDEAIKAEPVWDPAVHTASWRAVWAYSAKRAARDNTTLTAQENRARAVIDGDKQARKPRFVKAATSGFALDERALTRARALVGLKGYVTNIPTRLMPSAEVIAHYHDLWHVEQSFRKIGRASCRERVFQPV
jgi:hypothetical protein